ncbi:hypothetical protein ZIOFF_058770 [Zingiber officinale]|uniref:BHLH domain-containing protein n=1 Tax=Zingiber officinale TaxID=94328 RepID=A0A8J5FH07_ZINOF|nr:hypothetical protein ZIOFF_058770 [Zingiber officinale]
MSKRRDLDEDDEKERHPTKGVKLIATGVDEEITRLHPILPPRFTTCSNLILHRDLGSVARAPENVEFPRGRRGPGARAYDPASGQWGVGGDSIGHREEGAMDHEAKRLKGMNTDENGNIKTEVEANSGICNKLNDQNSQPAELPKQNYIHVRARRGQATDSHSLAERARREKISERMKILEDLVPGCNKVIGKASILDEIINYIQALQHQVEFLSLKLEAVTTSMNSGFEVPTSKDASQNFGAQGHDTISRLTYTPHETREFDQNSTTDWLHMQIGGALERVT